MIYRLSLRPAAVEDMAEAEAYYESELEWLSVRFRNEVAEVLRRIEDNPHLFPYSDQPPYRKATLRIFPYCIYYSVLNRKIVVIAVHDARRDPRRWRERAKK